MSWWPFRPKPEVTLSAAVSMENDPNHPGNTPTPNPATGNIEPQLGDPEFHNKYKPTSEFLPTVRPYGMWFNLPPAGTLVQLGCVWVNWQEVIAINLDDVEQSDELVHGKLYLKNKSEIWLSEEDCNTIEEHLNIACNEPLKSLKES